jgi:pyruvate,orthophosphate dikinase
LYKEITMTKYVYFFGGGKAEGKTEMKSLLGGKGANLAEMANTGLPVPPGFTISTDACAYYSAHHRRYPSGMLTEVRKNLARLEKLMGKKLGDARDPLLVSVRSGAAISMPGMMDTVLNLGMNDRSVLGFIEKTGNARTGWDSYRRFIDMFGDVVMGPFTGLKHGDFEAELSRHTFWSTSRWLGLGFVSTVCSVETTGFFRRSSSSRR